MRAVAPDLRASRMPPVGTLLLALPGRPALVVAAAERWTDDGQPLPYRAKPHQRRLGVALYGGDGRWSAAVLHAHELAEVRPALAAWPVWGHALRVSASLFREAMRLSGARLDLTRALAAAERAVSRPPTCPWWARGRVVHHVGGTSLIYPTSV